MSGPRVSIGLPVYNGERFIAQALDSLLAQTFTDFELVVVDNCSTDATPEICRAFVARDARVRYVRNDRNLGGPGNFRRVFELCSGEYHKWSTADDYWAPTVVEKGVAMLDADPELVLAHPRTRLVNDRGELIRDYDDHLHLMEESPAARFRRVLGTSTLCHAHLGLIRRSVMLRTELIGSELGSDIRFLAELSLYGKFAVIPEYLFYRRFHEQSSSWDRGDEQRQRAYYDPSRTGMFGMHTWRRFARLTAAAVHAPIGTRERAKVIKYLGRRVIEQSGVLWREVKALGHAR